MVVGYFQEFYNYFKNHWNISFFGIFPGISGIFSNFLEFFGILRHFLIFSGICKNVLKISGV
jgi:hypothetical protein